MPGFRPRNSPPIRLFARLEQGCLPLGAALHRGTPPGTVHAGPAEPEFREPLSRELPDVVRPDSAPGAVPPVDWLDQVAPDPIGALESFALGWFPAEEATGNAAAGDDEAAAVTGELPPAPAAFHRLARLRPALHRFHDPVLKQPEHTGDRLVLARWAQGYRDRSIPWRRRERDGSGPVVWETEDPRSAYRETAVGQEPLSLLVRTPATATGGTLPSGLGCPPPAPDALSGPGPGQGVGGGRRTAEAA
ncbi:hypothetical protein AB0E96_38880, partial [Kitasatospora sp. NPDC036755]|uniref:hypothetical protein n=1 Tax=Kitasatospora sp. NPDC036755 TaxID=3154600 RepID=UPI0034042E0F